MRDSGTRASRPDQIGHILLGNLDMGLDTVMPRGGDTAVSHGGGRLFRDHGVRRKPL